MRKLLIGLALAFVTLHAVASGITEGQRGMLFDVLQDDLTAYLQGGNSTFSDDWSRVATTWTSDQEIGQRYAAGTVSADNFYGDRTIFIRGHYLGAQNWIGNDYRVQMALVVAIVDKSESSFLQGAKNGGMVEMACRTAGKEYMFVHVDHCEALKFAMAEIVEREIATVLSRRSKSDLLAINAADRADKAIAAENPCRNTFGGCIDDIRALVH